MYLLLGVLRQINIFLSYIKETASYIQWDNNDVRFIPEQHS
jgi:hypothetical protein